MINTSALAGVNDTPPICCVSYGETSPGCVKFACNDTALERCTECPDGYNLQEKTITVCNKQYTYTECIKSPIIMPGKECPAGQYGLFACMECPSPGTSAAGATLITDCYIPAGNGETDTTGKWEYTSNCYYSN